MADRFEKSSLGTIIEALPNAFFRAQMDDGNEILAYLSGKMRIYRIKVLVGDRVKIELGPDGKKGRIIQRL
jgi:translation initiation factor IF-1